MVTATAAKISRVSGRGTAGQPPRPYRSAEEAIGDLLLRVVVAMSLVGLCLFLLPIWGVAVGMALLWRRWRPVWWAAAVVALLPALVAWGLPGDRLPPAGYLEQQAHAGAALWALATARPGVGVEVSTSFDALLGDYVRAMWGYALAAGLPTGLLLALVASWGTTPVTPAAEEHHPEAPRFSGDVDRLADTGKLPGARYERPLLASLRRKPRVARIPLAWNMAGRVLALVGAETTYHGLVCGMTGKGKTVFMTLLIVAARALGWSVVVLDLKGSPALRRLFRALPCSRTWTPRGPLSVDLLRGAPEEVAGKLVKVAGTVTGQQFNQMSQGALTAIVKHLDAASTPRTFPAIQQALEAAASGPQPQQALVDMAARLKTVTEASVETYLRPGPDALRLEAAIRAGEPVLFSVPVPRLRLVGEKLGAWLLAECNRVASRLTATDWGRKSGKRCLVLVDEFAGLREQGAHAAEPLATVREGGVSVWLFTQTWSDLERLGDDTRSQIVGNTDVQIVFRQAEQHDQAAWSAQLGEYETQKFTRSLDGETAEATGNYRVRPVAAPYVRPGDLATLGIGHAYVRIGNTRPVAARFPIPRTAEQDDPDEEPEDDDGTPDVGATTPVALVPNADEVIGVEPPAVKDIAVQDGASVGDGTGANSPRGSAPRVRGKFFREQA